MKSVNRIEFQASSIQSTKRRFNWLNDSRYLPHAGRPMRRRTSTTLEFAIEPDPEWSELKNGIIDANERACLYRLNLGWQTIDYAIIESQNFRDAKLGELPCLASVKNKSAAIDPMDTYPLVTAWHPKTSVDIVKNCQKPRLDWVDQS